MFYLFQTIFIFLDVSEGKLEANTNKFLFAVLSRSKPLYCMTAAHASPWWERRNGGNVLGDGSHMNPAQHRVLGQKEHQSVITHTHSNPEQQN